MNNLTENKIIKIASENEMKIFAQKLAKTCKKGDIFALKGSLGVGKSFFARAFIQSLTSDKQSILSPTFNLVYNYNSIKGNIFHFDLYRLKSEIELENIGFFDNLQDSIYLIEWPEIAEKFLPSHHTITIEISDKENEQARKISIKPKSVIRK